MPLQGALAPRLQRVYLPLLTGLVLVCLLLLSGGSESAVMAAADAPGWLVLGVVFGG